MIEKLNKLFKSEKFKEVIETVEKIEENCPDSINPEILIIKANSIQLCDEKINYDLDDVENTLLEAISLDKECINAYMELGYFYSNVMDNPSKAKEFFTNGKSILHKKMLKITEGLNDVNEELMADETLQNKFSDLPYDVSNLSNINVEKDGRFSIYKASTEKDFSQPYSEENVAYA